mmetsp:Transcript_5782/g.8992  ORF Transcript_5782/g.8992 Transcript_5782/m.8992 type:complete len:102 (+) Transcript_5782:43-348(+)
MKDSDALKQSFNKRSTLLSKGSDCFHQKFHPTVKTLQQSHTNPQHINDDMKDTVQTSIQQTFKLPRTIAHPFQRYSPRFRIVFTKIFHPTLQDSFKTGLVA